MNIHKRNGIHLGEASSSRPCNLLFVEQQIFASSCLAERNLVEEINSYEAPCLPSASQTLVLSDDGDNNCLHTDHENSQFKSESFENVSDHNRDLLDDIDHHLRYQVDIEIEQFRSNLHNILSQRQHDSVQLSPLQTVPHFQGSPQDNSSSDCVLSSSSLADVPKILHFLFYHDMQPTYQGNECGLEASTSHDGDVCPKSMTSLRDDSLTPASSMHDFEEDASNFGVIHVNSEIEVERRVNQLLIKLQTASSILSNNLCREEYLT